MRVLVAGDQIDVWIVEHALGTGGMGSVYRCRNRNATRISAAVKVLDGDLRRFPEAEARFIREAEILFRLDHPNIVKVRNVRTDLDPPFLEMEFVEGESLEGRLQRGPIPLAEALSLMVQLASALAYLHASGVRHRDIKPANLLVKPDGRLKVVDFGLAMEAAATRLTQNNLAFGTVSYAPPEWLAPETLDAAKWDVYAAGVVFWEMLTGGMAFPVGGVGSARQQAAQVIFAKQGHPPLDPGERFPAEVRALVRDATHSDADRRLADGGALLDRVRAAGPELALPTGWHQPSPTPSVRVDRPRSEETLHFSRELEEAARASAPGAPVRTEVAARSTGWLWALGLGGGAAVLGVGLAAGLAVVFWALSGPTTTTRTVIARVEGIPTGVPVAVRLNGGTPTSVHGFESTFPAAPGTGVLSWAVGEGCDTGCPGATCPAWCGVGQLNVAVPAGSEPFAVSLPVTAPTPRLVKIPLPLLESETPVAVSLAGRPGAREGDAVAVADVTPGSYPLDVVIGTCPADARGCFPDRACPVGCISHVATLVVPWGAAPWDAPIALRAPAVAAPAPAPVAAPSPPPAPVAAPTSRAGGLVTVGQFSRWLVENPDWQPGALGVAGYLPDWAGAEPPGGADPSAPVTATTWGSARAYCASRGGLAPIDAPPERWASGPQLEWRKSDEGRVAWRANDGQTSTAGQVNRAIRGAGFRCAR